MKIKLNILALSIFTAILVTPKVQAQVTATPNDANSVVNQSGNTFTITGGTQVDKNVFHSLQKFGLNENQIADFVTNPNTKNILGRITGGDASVINGLIKVTGSNANLFLMNPAGIIFGSGASLNVPGSFTATTANGIGFGDKWFNAFGTNNYAELVGEPTSFAFTMSQPGSIFNGGDLTVGKGESLTLLGGTVVNTGSLSSQGGNINIAAIPGKKLVRISQEGSLLSLVLPTSTENKLNPENLNLNPLSLPELLTGGNYNGATRITVENGVIKLTGSNVEIPNDAGTAIVSHKVDVSGEIGGKVNILGEKVGVVGGNINANGKNGGGSVLIGGDYKGEGTVPNSQRTFISKDSVIKADAEVTGDGGRVITWADETTGFYGKISARGGKTSGDGGFVEVSGKENLAFDGMVDAGADFGKNGKLLLDPTDVLIGDNGTDNSRLPDTGNNKGIINADIFNFNYFISADRVVEVLEQTDVSIGAKGSIQVQKEIDASGNSTDSNLTLIGRKIEIIEPIKLSTGGNLILNSTAAAGSPGTGITLFNNIDTDKGSVTFNSENPLRLQTSTKITTKGGNINFNAPVLVSDGFSSPIIDATGTTGTGNIEFTKTINSSGINPANLTVRAKGDVNFQDAIGNIEPLGFLDILGKNINIKNIALSTLRASAEQDIKVESPGENLDFKFDLDAGRDIFVNAENITSGNFSELFATRDLELQASQNLTLQDFSKLTARRNLQLTGNNVTIKKSSSSFEDISATENLNITAQNNLNLEKVKLNAQNIDIESNSGNVTLLGTELNSTGNIQVRSPSQVNISEISGTPGTASITESSEDITITGGDIEITAFENPQSILRSGGNFSLVSNNNIIGNARISTAGNFSAGSGNFSQPALNLNGIISSNGDVSFGDYTGSSLKVEAKGSITGGNINITDIGTFPQTGDADINILNAGSALIMRAGVTELANSPQSGNVGGTNFTSTVNQSSEGGIQVGNINAESSVILSAEGDIVTGSIRTIGPSLSEPIIADSVNISSSAGKIIVDNIQVASNDGSFIGDINIDAFGVFQARGSDNLIGASFGPGQLQDVKASIVAPGTISIKHGGESFQPALGLEKDSNGQLVFRVLGGSDDGRQVVGTGGGSVANLVFVDDGTSVVANSTTIREIPFDINNIDENTSYTVGGIFIKASTDAGLYGSFQDTELTNSSDINVVGVPKPKDTVNPDAEIVQRDLNNKKELPLCTPQNQNIALNPEANTRGASNTSNSQSVQKTACRTVDENNNILKVVPDNRLDSNLPTFLFELGKQ